MKSDTSHSIGKSGNVYPASFRRIQAWRTSARCRGKMWGVDILRCTRDGRRGDVRCTRDGRRGDVRCRDGRRGDVRRTRDGRRGDVRCRDGRRGDVRCSKSRFVTARYFVGYVRFGRSFVWCRIL